MEANFSIIILAFNEEINIESCIESCQFSDDIHVVDSGSTDQTVPLAQRLGATVHFNKFESFAKQRNWATDNAKCKYDWVFHLEADERLTESLIDELRSIVQSQSNEFVGYYVPNKLMLHQQWLKRSGGYPIYQMRFFHRHKMRFVDFGHGQREEPDKKVGTLKHPYLHFAFSHGMERWLSKHNHYAYQEAVECFNSETKIQLGNLFSKDPLVRRRCLKSIAYRLPFRSSLRWIMIVVLQGGILDGTVSFTYAKMISTYDSMFQLHLQALRKDQRS